MTIVIFGGAGDLAHRKLLPALYNLHVDGLLPPRFAVVGVGRKAMTDEAYREFAQGRHHQVLAAAARRGGVAGIRADALLRQRVDRRRQGLAPLGARLDTIEHERGLPGNRIYYLAVPPTMFAPTVKHLARARFVDARRIAPSRASIVEKPIGRDLASARAINDAIAAVFDERQIYRIDHYLGKETVQNILVLRFANSIFEPLFNQKYIDHVQITVAEEEGVGTRAGYYEQAGALRDMVQNHMLQLLCAGRDGAAVLARRRRRARREAGGAAVAAPDRTARRSTRTSVRAQYAAGFEARQAGAWLPRRAGRRSAVAHRDLRGAAGLHRQLALGRRAVLPAHRQAAAEARERDRHPVEGRAADPVQRRPAAPLDPNVLSIRIQPDEGLRSASARRCPGRACASIRSRWTSTTAARSATRRRRRTSGCSST